MTQAEIDLINDIEGFEHDPYGFVLYSFPWGTGPLLDQKMEDWQSDVLKDLGKGLITLLEAIQIAVSSGHGIGKSALVAWIILWALSTKENTRGVVTANTATQLMTKTWPELTRWHNMFIAKHWFTVTATAIYSTNQKYEKTWRFDAIPWSKANTEAFAGLHNKGIRAVLIFDEASSIINEIWEVADGALTDSNTELIWCAFGNPTRNTGRFYDAFHKLKPRWNTRQIDSRSVGITNKEKFKKWAEDYGEDSDFFKVRCRGEFPKMGDRQFISSELVEDARRVVIRDNDGVGILTLDSAWGGGAEIVCGFRKNLRFEICWVQANNDDDISLARRLANTEDEKKADAVFIDYGYGTGVFSHGKSMGRKWMLIPFGGEAEKEKDHTGKFVRVYLNKRAQMYGLGRTWLKQGGQLPNDPTLAEQISAPEQIFRDDGIIQLEAKKDVIERIGDCGRGDSWALSFAMPVCKKEIYRPQPRVWLPRAYRRK